ncbi:MAG: DUF1802 family protein [Gemmataceae bacterium]
MLRTAFKEWSSVCRAIGDGRQSLILRKGGIAESGGVFRPEHDRFWLYPTHHHQPDDKASSGNVIHLSHFVNVAAVSFVQSLDTALKLAGLHIWDEGTVRQRFAYRTPGLYVLTVRAYRCDPRDVPERPEYAGCKTWVELAESVSIEGAEPVLDDATFATVQAEIAQRLS